MDDNNSSSSSSNESVKVAVRIRPLMGQEIMERCTECIEVDNTTNSILVIGNDKIFTFDYVFHTQSTQQSIYSQSISPLVDALFEGYNATCFAYGQTGSGKTYTMGSANDGLVFGLTEQQERDMGIIPRAVKHIFDKITETKALIPNAEFYLRVQFLELYGEELRDLLDPVGVAEGKTVSIREGASGAGIQIVGASEEAVKTPQDMLKALERGTLCRTTASTKMNIHSSRSHAIFTIILEQHLPSQASEPLAQEIAPTSTSVIAIEGESQTLENPQTVTSTSATTEFRTAKFHFVDLAGSERAKRTGATGKRLKEGININKGLLALGNVISALGDESKRLDSRSQHVPYRNSKLTRMLQDSLGGNSRTLMIACVSPADVNFEETLNTLRYANRARNIKNNATINRDPASSQIAILKAQVAALKAQLMQQQGFQNNPNGLGMIGGVGGLNAGSLSSSSLSVGNQGIGNQINVSAYENEIKRLSTELDMERRARLELEDELKATKEQLDCLHEAHQVLLTTESNNDEDEDEDGSNNFLNHSIEEGEGYGQNNVHKLDDQSREYHQRKQNASLNTSLGSIKAEDLEEEEDMLPHSVITSLLEEDERERDSISKDVNENEKENNQEKSKDATDVSQRFENDEETVQLKMKYKKTQAALRKMVNTYDKTLRSKQKMMEQVVQERKKYEAMKQHYEAKMMEMNEEVRETQIQRDELDNQIRELEKKTMTEASANEVANLKKELKTKNDKLRELEIQTRKLAEAEKLSLKFQKKEKDIQEEILIMKRAKVEYQRKMEEETKKYRTELSERAKEIIQLKRAQFQLTKDKSALSAKNARDEMLLKLKTEQVTAMQRKLREAQKLAQHSERLSVKEKEQRDMLEKFAVWRVKRDEELQDLRLALAKKESAIQRKAQLCEELERLKQQAEARTQEAEAKAMKAERDKANAEAALREAVRDFDAADDATVERDAIEELEQRLEAAESEIMFRDTQIQAAAASIDRAQESEEIITETIVGTLAKEFNKEQQYASTDAMSKESEYVSDGAATSASSSSAATSASALALTGSLLQERIKSGASDIKISTIEQANEVCKVLMQLFVDSKRVVKKQQTEIKRLKLAQQTLEKQQENQRRLAFAATLSSSLVNNTPLQSTSLNDIQQQQSQQMSSSKNDIQMKSFEANSMMSNNNISSMPSTPKQGNVSYGSLSDSTTALESQRRIRNLEEQLKSLQAEPESSTSSTPMSASQLLLPVAFYVPLNSPAPAPKLKLNALSPIGGDNNSSKMNNSRQNPLNLSSSHTPEKDVDRSNQQIASIPANQKQQQVSSSESEAKSITVRLSSSASGMLVRPNSTSKIQSSSSSSARRASSPIALKFDNQHANIWKSPVKETISSQYEKAYSEANDESFNNINTYPSMNSQDIRIQSEEDTEESPGWIRVAKMTTESYLKKLELEQAERKRKQLKEESERKKLEHIKAKAALRPSIFGTRPKSSLREPSTLQHTGYALSDQELIESLEEEKENQDTSMSEHTTGKVPVSSSTASVIEAHIPIHERLFDPRSYTGTQKIRAEESQALSALTMLSSGNSANTSSSQAASQIQVRSQQSIDDAHREPIKQRLALERERRKKEKAQES